MMKDIFRHVTQISPISMNEYISFETEKTVKRHFEILKELSQLKMFPRMYIDYINNIEDKKEQDEISQKFFKIYLYLQSKIKDPQKLYAWFLKGNLPEETSFGSSSMTLFNNSVNKINNMCLLINRTVDKMDEQRSRLSEKSNKKTQDSLMKNQQRYNRFTNEFDYTKDLLEDIIYEIESTLASGRRL